MKRNNGFIPGVKPGKKTADYLDSIMSRITLPGSIFLAIVAILPAFAQICGVSAEFSQFFGGTSLLILVGVVLDTLQQIESHLMMRHYDGLMKSGKIKGRSGALLKRIQVMIYLKTDEEIELMRESNLLVGMTLGEMAKWIAPGITTLKLDKIAEEFIRDHGAQPGFLGYGGFPNTLCISVNEVIVHGIPNSYALREEILFLLIAVL